MKQLFTLLLFISFYSHAQEEVTDLGINGKDLIELKWGENTLTLNTSTGAGAYSPRGNDGFIRTINIENGDVLNEFLDKKGINLAHANKEGYYLITGAQGAIINPFGSSTPKYTVIKPGGKEVGQVKYNDKPIESDLNEDTFLVNNYAYTIGPKAKGYKLSKKLNKSKPIVWHIYRVNLETLEDKLLTFTPKPMEGKEYRNGYTLLKVEEDRFYLLGKNYLPSNDEKKPTQQEFILLSYGFDGKLIEEKTFVVDIDNENFYFAFAGLPNGYTSGTAGSVSVRVMKSAATGTIFINPDDKGAYYVVSLFGARSKKEGVHLYVAKYLPTGEKLWETQQPFMEKNPGEKELKYISATPTFIDGKVNFSKFNAASPKQKKVEIISINSEDGTLGETKEITNLGSYFERAPTWHQTLYGNTIKDELSDKVILDGATLISYYFNPQMKEFLKGSQPEEDTFYYTNIVPGGDTYVLEACYKNRTYRLLKL